MADEILERWALIPGFGGAYSASTLGRVRREERRAGHEMPTKLVIREKILSPRGSSNGYLNVCLRHGGLRKCYTVHRLVLLAFIGQPSDGFVACHMNGKKDDNRLVNLRWDSQAGNMRDKWEHGTSLHGEKNSLAKLDPDSVRAINLDPRPLREISMQYGVTIATCSCIKNGQTWAHLNMGEAKKNRPGRPDRKQLPVETIRAIRADQRPQRKIAAEYGLQQQLVSKIKAGKVWADVI